MNSTEVCEKHLSHHGQKKVAAEKAAHVARNARKNGRQDRATTEWCGVRRIWAVRLM